MTLSICCHPRLPLRDQMMMQSDQRPGGSWHYLKFIGITKYPFLSLLQSRPRSLLLWWHCCASSTVMMGSLFLMIPRPLSTTRYFLLPSTYMPYHCFTLCIAKLLLFFFVFVFFTLYLQHLQWCPAHVSGTNINLICCFCFRTWDHQPPWTTYGAMTSGEATWVATLVTNPTDLSLSLHFGKGTCPLCQVTHWHNTKLTTNACFSMAGSQSVYIISHHTTTYCSSCQHFNLYIICCAGCMVHKQKVQAYLAFKNYNNPDTLTHSILQCLSCSVIGNEFGYFLK